MNANEDPVSFSPDGLTEQAIDALLKEMDAAANVRPLPTSALLDGSAAEQRLHRMQRRAVVAVPRVLPVRRPASGPDEQEAA